MYIYGSYIYGSYRKVKTGFHFFGTLCIYAKDVVWIIVIRFCNSSFTAQLPAWLRSSVTNYANFGLAMRDMAAFFKNAEKSVTTRKCMVSVWSVILYKFWSQTDYSHSSQKHWILSPAFAGKECIKVSGKTIICTSWWSLTDLPQ